MFVIRVSQDYAYRNVLGRSHFKQRLESRVKLAPEEFDRWMAQKEQNFGKANYTPNVNRYLLTHLIYREASIISTMGPTT
jgi:hypothetical protein